MRCEQSREHAHTRRSGDRSRGSERPRRRSLQPVFHPGRPVRHRGGRAAPAARFSGREDDGAGAIGRAGVQRCGPHGVHGGRAVRHRDVRVLGAARESRSRDTQRHRLPDPRSGGTGQCGHAAGHPLVSGRPGVLRRGHEGERGVPGGPRGIPAPRIHRHREGNTWDPPEPGRAPHVCHEPRLEHDRRRTPRTGVDQRARPADATCRGDLAGSRRRESRHGERERRRQGALGVGSLRRRGVRLRHGHGAADAPHKGGARTARTVRVAAAGEILPGSHGQHAVSATGRPPRIMEARIMDSRTRVAAAVSVVCLACSHATPAPVVHPAPTAPAFDRSSLDTACAPCRDFFQFANGGWAARTEIPGEVPRWGGFNALYEHHLDVLRAVLEGAGRDTTATPATNHRKLGVFYATCMDSAGAEAAGVRPLQADLERVAHLSSVADVQAEVARQQRMGLDVLFTFTANQDAKHSSQMIAEASQGGLGLPDRDYYTKTDSASERFKQQYLAHVARTLTLLGTGPDEAERAAQRIMTIESALATASMTRVELRDPNAIYHKLTVAELSGLAPAFAWRDYFGQIGAPALPGLNVQQPEFFKAVNRLLDATPVADWRWYLRWHLVDAAAP